MRQGSRTHSIKSRSSFLVKGFISTGAPVGMAGHEDHARQEGRVVALEGAIEGWAVQDGHQQITQYDAIGVLFQEVQRVDPVLRRIHLVTT